MSLCSESVPSVPCSVPAPGQSRRMCPVPSVPLGDGTRDRAGTGGFQLSRRPWGAIEALTLGMSHVNRLHDLAVVHEYPPFLYHRAVPRGDFDAVVPDANPVPKIEAARIDNREGKSTASFV